MSLHMEWGGRRVGVMDSIWGGGEPQGAMVTGGTIGGINAPSGAVVVDADALADTLASVIERFRDEIGDDFESDDLAWALVRAIQRTVN
ncbi:hypothetical protein ABZ508_35440 [Streptomyces lavendulocolor]|uniref:Uncharacterized protein n=1 Tax=Streptomyces lavendulocolor TaxID=67316 RepID=A0ABV2WH27_9ACTN